MSSTNNDSEYYYSFVNTVGDVLCNWRIYKCGNEDQIFDLAITQKQQGLCRGNQIPKVFQFSSTAQWCGVSKDYIIHEGLSCKLVEERPTWLKFRIETFPNRFEYVFIPK